MNKKITFSLGLVAVFFFLTASLVYGSLEDSIKKYNISFPIAELGNCSDFPSCRNYCDDPVNKEACIAYAKKKGFYKKEEIDQKKTQILAIAQEELGCNSMTSCKSLCENEVNFEKCTEFAKRHGLGGGQLLSSKNQAIIAKAKTILGCNSPSSCKALCENPQNHQKCDQFAKEAGLEGGVHMRGPGGCTSEETCRAYCSDPAHEEECSKSGPGPDDVGEPPCRNPKECDVYCKEHQDECRQFGWEPPRENQRGPDETDEFCAKYPERCQDEGPDYQSGEDFCRDHPEACPGEGSLDPEKEGFEEHCQKYPEDCADTPGPGAENSETAPQEESVPPAENTPTQPLVQPSPDVQGVSTVRGTIKILVDLLLEKISSFVR